MTRAAVLATFVTVMVCGPWTAVLAGEQRHALTNIGPIGYDAIIGERATAFGITKAKMREQLELSLRRNKIPIVTHLGQEGVLGRLTVTVQIFQPSDYEGLIIIVGLRLMHLVTVRGLDGGEMDILASIWTSGWVGSSSDSPWNFIRERLSDDIDKFSLDFLQANPNR